MSVLIQPEQPNQTKSTQPNPIIGEVAHANKSCSDILLWRSAQFALQAFPACPELGEALRI